MPSKSWVAFEKNAQDIDRLLEIHTTMGGTAKGRRHRLEVLNKSSIVLITAFWEAYCEDLAAEALDHILANVASASLLPENLRKQIATDIKKDPHELAVWDLADAGWRAKVRRAAAPAARDLICRAKGYICRQSRR